MLVINCGTSFPKRRVNNLRILYLLLTIAVILLSIFSARAYSPLSDWTRKQSLVVIVVIILLEIIVSVRLWSKNVKYISEDKKKYVNASRGAEGEKIVRDILENYSDSESVAYSNVKFRELGGADIDFLIVSPKGVIVVEVKNLSSVLRFFWKLWPSHPFCQVRRYAKALERFLKQLDQHPPIKKVIVSIGQFDIPRVRTGVWITGEHGLTDYLSSPKLGYWSQYNSGRASLRKLIEDKTDPRCGPKK